MPRNRKDRYWCRFVCTGILLGAVLCLYGFLPISIRTVIDFPGSTFAFTPSSCGGVRLAVNSIASTAAAPTGAGNCLTGMGLSESRECSESTEILMPDRRLSATAKSCSWPYTLIAGNANDRFLVTKYARKCVLGSLECFYGGYGLWAKIQRSWLHSLFNLDTFKSLLFSNSVGFCSMLER